MILATASKRDRRIVFERATTSEGPHGDEVATWKRLEERWAQVLFGAGAERRQAAQTGASQAATFRVLSDSMTRDVRVTDRIQFDGAAWNIVGIAPLDRASIDFSAVRAA
jgi:SPP1 family predicted phage head-tail adaptor